jgi:hypothetical protein
MRRTTLEDDPGVSIISMQQDVHAATLTWVLIDDQPHHVSEFAHLSPRRRPPAFCPHCARRLTLKLGAIRQHHAAHAPGDPCPATHPETALHLGCKFALASALSAEAGPGARLSIIQRCAGDDRTLCGETLIREWSSGWDRVTVEHRVGERRPDIALHRAGKPIAAIEIVVSNAVSPEKAQALEALGLPWIEVRGDADALPLEVRKNVAGGFPAESHDRSRLLAPLPVSRTSDGTWRCARHGASTLRAARVVDVYHQGGARDRFIYRFAEQIDDRGERVMHLQRGKYTIASAPVGDRQRLRLAFTEELGRLTEHAGSFSDSPMRWATGDVATDLVEEALLDRVGSDPTPLATRYPRRWFYAKDSGRWFLPDDMRDVRWDREPIDAFAAHPAWKRAHGAVRERAAPEGSWKTPVFAARPNATMFLPSPVIHVNGDGNGLVVVDVSARASARRRAIVVVECATSDQVIRTLAESLRQKEIDAVWLSSPRDWCDAFASVVWAAAGRDARGRGGVVIDGVGVFRADQFVRALAGGDRRLSATAIRRSMADRMRRLSMR